MQLGLRDGARGGAIDQEAEHGLWLKRGAPAAEHARLTNHAGLLGPHPQRQAQVVVVLIRPGAAWLGVGAGCSG